MENLSSSGAGSEPGRSPNVEQQLRSKVENAKKETANLKRAASEQVTSSLESAKANFQEAAQTAAGYGQSIVNEQKNKLAEIVQQYGQAAQGASADLRHQGHAVLSSRADQVASGLERASTYLREKNFAEIYQDAEHFTRRRPEITFGIMFAAGLVTARFLKASDRDRVNRRDPQVAPRPFPPVSPGAIETENNF
jgi:ElaB/YqjD/DUF883 family membrane-anchored ribosome-binding protein